MAFWVVRDDCVSHSERHDGVWWNLLMVDRRVWPWLISLGLRDI